MDALDAYDAGIALEELSDAEVAALDEAVERDQERSGELRTRLGERPAVTGTGGFVAGRVAPEAPGRRCRAGACLTWSRSEAWP